MQESIDNSKVTGQVKNVRMPSAVLSLLAENDIGQENILTYSQADMNTMCEYADGFVVVTAKQIAVVTSPHVDGRPSLFKGYVAKSDMMNRYKALEGRWTVELFDIDSIASLKIETLVACSLLIAEIDGHERALTAFSNLFKKSMHKVQRTYDRLHNPKPEFAAEAQEEPKNSEEDEDDQAKEYCPKCGMMYPDSNRKICPRCMDRKSLFARAFKLFSPYYPKMAIMVLCFLGMAGLNLVWPYLNGKILYDKILAMDEGFLKQLGIEDGRFITALLMIVLTMFATRLTIKVLQIVQGVISATVVTSVIADIKKKIFEHMGHLSISFFRSKQTGGLMTRVVDDAEHMSGFFLDGMPYVMIHGLTTVAMFIMMFSINWQIALVAVILFPVAIIVGYKLLPGMWSMYGHLHRVKRRFTSQVNDNLTGARVVKAFGQEHRENDRFESNNGRYREAEMTVVSFRNFFNIVFNSVYQLLVTAVWGLGVWFILGRNEMEIGVLITLVGYAGQLQGPIGFFSEVFYWWSDSMNSAERVFEILDAVPTIREADEPKTLVNPQGHVELKNVSFGYEINRPVLKEISLDIPGGSMLGIVGRSGAGKTTLVNLISRMYDPQEGSILIDGTDVRELEFKSLRRNVAMVSQETYIFMGTVRENIAYADPNATMEDVIRAAKLASAHEFIMRMPDGYDTVIGASGRELSGGERQRISIARAILANPKILILDEATASVDTETERAIQASLSYLIQGRTTISIAHRLSTLRDADSLVVLDEGRITERGTAAELLELKGTYYKLMELQTKALALRE